jgi:hypothetical protein
VEPTIVYDPNYKPIATAASGKCAESAPQTRAVPFFFFFFFFSIFFLLLLGRSFGYEIQNTGYAKPPQLVRLKGSRYQIGYDYADLLHGETSAAFTAFMNSEMNLVDQELLKLFLTFCWDRFLSPHVPRDFMEELEGKHFFFFLLLLFFFFF